MATSNEGLERAMQSMMVLSSKRVAELSVVSVSVEDAMLATAEKALEFYEVTVDEAPAVMAVVLSHIVTRYTVAKFEQASARVAILNAVFSHIVVDHSQDILTGKWKVVPHG